MLNKNRPQWIPRAPHLHTCLQLCSYMPLVIIPCLWFFRQLPIRDSAPNPRQIELNFLAEVHEVLY